jgi:HlyD family secretion protein
MIRLIIPVIAIGALAWALLYVFFLGNKALPAAEPLQESPMPQFESYISASGIIESASENIDIGTNLPGIVTHVYVQEGDQVQQGANLFTIDDRAARADLISAESRAKAARAQVNEAQEKLANAQSQLAKLSSVQDNRAISRNELDNQRFAVSTASAGVDSLRATARSAEADADAARVNLSRLTVTAPTAGQILKLNIHPGEYAPAGSLQNPLILLGDTQTLHIRADIDENDAWRFMPGAQAHASLRGNPDMKTDITFVRVQPYVTPKVSLTGSSIERVDTRVLQVIYSFPASELKAYVGQLMDVFIAADPVARPAKPAVSMDGQETK